ncbi:hypothetical protein [Moorena sp. SIO3A2]|uniref:hypothetical protein n=1 Tax=Moorena sp. SIO3A2 TaxID=2607841 RepID=UPI0013B74DA4|nr:hypothetical protein [Moorena sp. SIO3A2]NER91355.1 hypothetical protein [Moorena sp. SIO3A2]
MGSCKASPPGFSDRRKPESGTKYEKSGIAELSNEMSGVGILPARKMKRARCPFHA